MNRKLIQFSLIVASLFGANCGQLIGLRVSPLSQSVNQPSNQQFVVTCKGFGAEPSLFSRLKWFDPRNEEISEEYSRRVNPDIRVEEAEVGQLLLHFANPLVDNSGNYSCSGTFQHSDALKTRILINFFQDVEWEDCPQIQALILGAKHERIRCKAKSNPKPNIAWSKEGKALDSFRYQIDSNGVSINDVITQADGGVFRVRALVTETGRLHDIFISVQIFQKPEIVSLDESGEGTEGEEATLHCAANGRPQPLVTWLDPMKRNLSHVGGYHVDRNSGTLIISRVKRVDNSGQFTCIAENEAGRAQQTTLFRVTVRPVITSFNNQSFDQNSDSILECRATGEPRPLLTIRRDGDSRELQTGDPRVTLDVEEVAEESVLRLRLTQSRRSDDALYFCRADNKRSQVERVGHLEVRFSPDLSRTPLTSVKHWNLQPINITCIADAIPNATLRWFFRGFQLQNNNVYTIEENTLGISRLHINARDSQRDIYGQYKCEAINSLGNSEIKIQLDQAFRPGAILQITYDRITPTSFTFKVMAPSFDGGLPLNYIHIQYRRQDSQQMTAKKWSLDSSDTYFLDGLRPRTRYWLKFAAENVVGVGDWSAERMVETLRESRPEKPQFRNLPFDAAKQVVSPFSDQFMATWTLPADNGRKIRYFEVKWYSVKRSESGFEARDSEVRVNSVSMSDQSMTSFTIRDLKANSYYALEIRANNELGFSDSETLVFKTNDAPSSVDHSKGEESSSGPSLALMAGLTVAVIIVLLIATDAIFFLRYKIGIIYFLTQNVFKKEENIPKSVSCVENRAFE